MPYYIKSPFKPSPKLVVVGRPIYLLGSFDDRSSDTKGYLKSYSVSGNVATIVMQITDGPDPAVGQNINIQNASAAVLNTTGSGVAITGGSFDVMSGLATLTFALTTGNVSSTPVTGQVIIPTMEVGEAMANGSSAPVAVPFSYIGLDQSKTITVVASFPGNMPLAATVTLQEAVADLDSEYADVGTVCVVAAGVISSGPMASINSVGGRFYRAKISGLTTDTGSHVNPSIIVKLVA